MPPPKPAKKDTAGLKVTFRFADDEHRDLVLQAGKKAKLSLNAWMVAATLTKAREELGV